MHRFKFLYNTGSVTDITLRNVDRRVADMTLPQLQAFCKYLTTKPQFSDQAKQLLQKINKHGNSTQTCGLSMISLYACCWVIIGGTGIGLLASDYKVAGAFIGTASGCVGSAAFTLTCCTIDQVFNLLSYRDGAAQGLGSHQKVLGRNQSTLNEDQKKEFKQLKNEAIDLFKEINDSQRINETIASCV